MSHKVAIQGVPGSFHHQVSLNLFGESTIVLPFNTFELVAKSVASGEADYGVMAIENSIAGAILPNYEIIDRNGLFVKGEYYLPIAHQLMGLPGQTIEEIKEVRSHPMAILQCKPFLAQYPHIEAIDDVDTAAVAERIANNQLKGVAAIASKIAAEIYGLEIIAKNIQTVKNNFTRFIILEKESSPQREEVNKVSFKVTIQNEKGGLAQLLTMLSDQGLDLSKIQSIPVIQKPWEYAFFIDAVFTDYNSYQQAMQLIRENYGELKIFGEYKSQK